MKKILALLLIILSHQTQTRIGCMDNSWHLTKAYDTKEMHFVACDCDCTNTLGACPSCGHIHNAQPWTIINNKKQKIKKLDTITTPPTMQQTMARLIELRKELNKIKN